jgi:glutathione S-transferase
MITVYEFPKTRTIRVTWTLEEIRAEYELVKVDLMKGEGRRPAFLEINPTGKVPAMKDGDFILTESVAICTYLADKFPDAGLIPEPRTRERAIHDQMCYLAVTEIEELLWTKAKHTFVLPEKLRVPAIHEILPEEFSRAIDVLEEKLGDKEFVLGDQFSVADILIGHLCSWARNSEMPIASSRVNAYADRLLARPALARARGRELE